MIINADDYGLNESASKAIEFSLKNNFIDTTTMVVNIDSFVNRDFIEKYNEKIGFHLNLTEGKPLSRKMRNCRSFTDENGMFYNNLQLRKFPKNIILSRKEKDAVKEEIQLQMSKFRELSKSDFFDSHHHIHTVPSILFIAVKVAKQYNFCKVRILRNLNIKNKFILFFKNLLNLYLSRSFKTTAYFGSLNDFIAKRDKITKIADTEIMTHPVLAENNIVIDRSSNLLIQLIRGKTHV